MRKASRVKPTKQTTRASKPADQSHRFRELGQVAVTLKLGDFDIQVLNWGYLEPKWWRNYLHTHSAFEICYAFAGQGTFSSDGIVHRVRMGDVFIARPGDAHEIIASNDDPLGIFFWLHTLLGGRTAHTDHTGVNALLDAFAKSKRVVARAPASMPRTLEMLCNAAIDVRAGFTQEVHALAIKLILDTARAGVDRPTPIERVATHDETSAESIVQTAERYVRDNFERPIGVRDIAAQVHVGDRHLGRLFLLRRGVSVMRFVTNVRVDTASQLLLDPNRTIKKVALECGFSDVRYFTTVFRRHIGDTPARFRARGGTRFHSRK